VSPQFDTAPDTQKVCIKFLPSLLDKIYGICGSISSPAYELDKQQASNTFPSFEVDSGFPHLTGGATSKARSASWQGVNISVGVGSGIYLRS